MKQFEYLTIQKPLDELDLNIFGAKGWELVTHSVVFANKLLGHKFGQEYIFKREKL